MVLVKKMDYCAFSLFCTTNKEVKVARELLGVLETTVSEWIQLVN